MFSDDICPDFDFGARVQVENTGGVHLFGNSATAISEASLSCALEIALSSHFQRCVFLNVPSVHRHISDIEAWKAGHMKRIKLRGTEADADR